MPRSPKLQLITRIAKIKGVERTTHFFRLNSVNGQCMMVSETYKTAAAAKKSACRVYSFMKPGKGIFVAIIERKVKGKWTTVEE